MCVGHAGYASHSVHADHAGHTSHTSHESHSGNTGRTRHASHNGFAGLAIEVGHSCPKGQVTGKNKFNVTKVKVRVKSHSQSKDIGHRVKQHTKIYIKFQQQLFKWPPKNSGKA